MKRTGSPTNDDSPSKVKVVDAGHTGPVDADTQLIYLVVIVCEQSGHLIVAAVVRDEIPEKYLRYFKIATDPPGLPITELNRVPNENPIDMMNKFCLYALFSQPKRMNPETKRAEADPNIVMSVLEKNGLGKADIGALLKYNRLNARSKVDCIGFGEKLLSSSLLFARRNTTINEVRFTFFDSWRDELENNQPDEDEGSDASSEQANDGEDQASDSRESESSGE